MKRLLQKGAGELNLYDDNFNPAEFTLTDPQIINQALSSMQIEGKFKVGRDGVGNVKGTGNTSISQLQSNFPNKSFAHLADDLNESRLTDVDTFIHNAIDQVITQSGITGNYTINGMPKFAFKQKGDNLTVKFSCSDIQVNQQEQQEQPEQQDEQEMEASTMTRLRRIAEQPAGTQNEEFELTPELKKELVDYIVGSLDTNVSTMPYDHEDTEVTLKGSMSTADLQRVFPELASIDEADWDYVANEVSDSSELEDFAKELIEDETSADGMENDINNLSVSLFVEGGQLVFEADATVRHSKDNNYYDEGANY